MKESLEFYNNFDNKLIKDYANANKRIKSAIESLAQFILEKENSSILDIGCGLGWSTYEFSRFFQNSTIEGVDLSPVLIDKAKTLFQNANLKYKVFDVLENIPDREYDAIVMIDVYEHIPVSERSRFHKSLNDLLKTEGRIIMACPSIYHQDFLKKHNPNGLQPVDEDVSHQNLQTLCSDINAEMIYFEYKSIWRQYDYFYAVIQKNVHYDSPLKIRDNKIVKIENRNLRLKKLKDKLDITFPRSNSKRILKKIIKKFN